MTFEDYKTGKNVSQPQVISLKYENEVTVKKFPFMKVQTYANLSSILDGDFVGSDMFWWRGDQIPFVRSLGSSRTPVRATILVSNVPSLAFDIDDLTKKIGNCEQSTLDDLLFGFRP